MGQRIKRMGKGRKKGKEEQRRYEGFLIWIETWQYPCLPKYVPTLRSLPSGVPGIHRFICFRGGELIGFISRRRFIFVPPVPSARGDCTPYFSYENRSPSIDLDDQTDLLFRPRTDSWFNEQQGREEGRQTFSLVYI